MLCQFLECQAIPAQTQSPPQKSKVPLLKTFWRRFWYRISNLVAFVGPAASLQIVPVCGKYKLQLKQQLQVSKKVSDG